MIVEDIFFSPSSSSPQIFALSLEKEDNMKTLNYALELIDCYHKNYRNPLFPPFKIGSIYALYPVENEYGWPSCWFDFDKPGVYLILNDKKEVLYIGQSEVIGHRLSEYFAYDSDRSCRARGNWSDRPCYILTVTVPLDSAFERLGLEEFLIGKVNPEDNVRARKG